MNNDLNLFLRDKGLSSLNIDNHKRMIESSLTPFILEERNLNVTQIDVFSRLMMDRIIWVAGTINDLMSITIQAQLLYLNSIGDGDITMYISSYGGSVDAGLSIVDVMDYVSSDIRTVNTGIAASMGAVLLGAGTKGKRSGLRFSKTMIHQTSGGAYGTYADAQISMKEWEKTNNLLFKLLGEYCGKDAETVKSDANRDLWFSVDETIEYGLIDEVIKKKK